MVTKKPKAKKAVTKNACVITSLTPITQKENEMDYEDLEDEIKQALEAIADNDPYGLSPKTLYKNILCSTGDDEALSKIFEVPLSLVKRIKRRE